MHVLKASSDDGHLFLPSTELLQQSQKLLESDRAVIAGALESLIASRRVKAEGVTREGPHVLAESAIYLPALHAAETGIVTELERLLNALRSLPRVESGHV